MRSPYLPPTQRRAAKPITRVGVDHELGINQRTPFGDSVFVTDSPASTSTVIRPGSVSVGGSLRLIQHACHYAKAHPRASSASVHGRHADRGWGTHLLQRHARGSATPGELTAPGCSILRRWRIPQ